MQTTITNSPVQASIHIIRRIGNTVIVKLGGCNVTTQAKNLGVQ